MANESQSLSLAKRLRSRTYGLSPERLSFLRRLGQDSELAYRVTLERVHSETERQLDSLAQAVHEGKRVHEAANFARWLQFSGVLELLSRFALPGQSFPPLDRKLTDMLQECGEHFRGGRVDSKYSESDIAEINRKLDALLASSARPAAGNVISLDGHPSQPLAECEAVGR